MNGPPNVNPFVRDYTEKIRPVLETAMGHLRPELDDLANIYITKLPWFKRAVVRMAWWPILMVVLMRVADAVIEALFAWRGEVKVGDCSEPTRKAFAAAPRIPEPDAGNPHPILVAASAPGSPRRLKVIRTIDRGRSLYRADVKDGWVEDINHPSVKRFKCYEIAYNYYLSIPCKDRVGDPKIVDCPGERSP